jgi:hypothetical protein
MVSISVNSTILLAVYADGFTFSPSGEMLWIPKGSLGLTDRGNQPDCLLAGGSQLVLEVPGTSLGMTDTTLGCVTLPSRM